MPFELGPIVHFFEPGFISAHFFSSPQFHFPVLELNRRPMPFELGPIVHFFSSVAYVWNKNYWADREKVWFFLNLIFSAVTNLKFRHMFCFVV
jgi:hypothetical protein